MEIDVADAAVVDVYRMLVGLVTPRPIAWVTTLSPAGVVNLAPFSFYNAFGANPPVVVISPTLTRDGKRKDTLVNIEHHGAFVINASTEHHAEAINRTSAALPPDESEVELVGMATIASRRVPPPRLAGVPFALECRLRQVIPIGSGPISANLVIGEVVTIVVDDDFLDATGQPDPRRIRAVGRLGADHWCRTTDLFEQGRPG
ncbi:MAG: flavin reductase family protein [Planctomycetaceae bacterium]